MGLVLHQAESSLSERTIAHDKGKPAERRGRKAVSLSSTPSPLRMRLSGCRRRSKNDRLGCFILRIRISTRVHSSCFLCPVCVVCLCCTVNSDSDVDRAVHPSFSLHFFIHTNDRLALPDGKRRLAVYAG